MSDPVTIILATGLLLADMTDWVESIAASGLLPWDEYTKALSLVAQSKTLIAASKKPAT